MSRSLMVLGLDESAEFDGMVDLLEKGNSISTVDIERVSGIQADKEEFRWLLLRLVDYARRRLEAQGKSFVFHCKGMRVNACNDVEADAYTRSRFAGGIEQMKRSTRERAKIDYSQLSNEVARQAQDFDRSTQLILKQVEDQRRELRAITSERLRIEGDGGQETR